MRLRPAAVRALVSRDQWQAAARKWHTDYPPRGEVAEPGLRRTPGERVNSEGFRGFKSPPLRQRVWQLRQSPWNSAKWPPLWPVLSAQPNQRRTKIGVIRRCASVSLRAGTGWFGFAVASAKLTLVADAGGPLVGAMDLFEADHSLLGRPVLRQGDMRGGV